MKFRELCAKEIVQLSNGACLGRADDLELDPATAQVKSLLLLGRPHLFGLLGRDETLVTPGRTSKHWEWTRFWSARSCRSRKPKSRVSGKNCGTGWTAEIFREFFLHQGLILQKIGL